MTDPFKIRSDVERVACEGFAYPLGVEAAEVRPPDQGYCVTWTEGEADAPDTYALCVVISHERLRPLLAEILSRLPERVMGIVEVGSRDAFRAVDVFLSAKPIAIDRFLDAWLRFEPIFLEDASLAVGVNTETPFMEVFIDQDKRVTVHVEPEAKGEIEAILVRHGLQERDETDIIVPEEEMEQMEIRPILVEDPGLICDVDQLLMLLRYDWLLVLDEDVDRNVDAVGRNLGRTLWHAVIVVEPSDGPPGDAVYASAWLAAGSRREVEGMVRDCLDGHPAWSFREFYTLDRVAFDDRPEELSQLTPGISQSEVFSFIIEDMDDPGGHGVGHG
ncbi:MAG: hypothetical protein MK116_00755 [Phycisphaerales bacterium]|nr:hypothetical protein [Phycisphaerales bacterium]